MLNLSFWPFAVDPHSTISYLPGARPGHQRAPLLVFDATTSLGLGHRPGHHQLRLILLVGPAMLATFRRASRRAAFEAPVVFADLVDVDTSTH